MKQDIIEQMSAKVSNHRYAQSDFSVDLRLLKNYEEEFFWVVCETGTSIALVGPSEIEKWGQCSANRFQLFRDMNAPIHSVLYFSGQLGTTYFYKPNTGLVEVNKDEVISIWHNMFCNRYSELVAEYWEEYDMRDAKLPIIVSSSATRELLKCTLQVAKSLGDDSLWKCLENLKQHYRNSINHHIELYTDFELNSFGWSEIVDGKCRMNGGIIYHPDREENRWQIHT